MSDDSTPFTGFALFTARMHTHCPALAGLGSVSDVLPLNRTFRPLTALIGRSRQARPLRLPVQRHVNANIQPADRLSPDCAFQNPLLDIRRQKDPVRQGDIVGLNRRPTRSQALWRRRRMQATMLEQQIGPSQTADRVSVRHSRDNRALAGRKVTPDPAASHLHPDRRDNPKAISPLRIGRQLVTDR